MTVIVAYRNVLYADSKVKNNDTAFPSPKIFNVNGMLFGAAGDNWMINEFLAHLEEGWARQYDSPNLSREEGKTHDFEALVIRENGEIWHYDEYFSGSIVEGLHYAVGTGAGPALACIALQKQRPFGVTPIDVIKAVCETDENCGLPVQWMTLHEKALRKAW